MNRFSLSWSEARQLRAWELQSFETIARDADLMDRNRNRMK